MWLPSVPRERPSPSEELALEPHDSSTPTLKFIRREARPERLVVEVEIVFGESAGILSGMKLTGLGIWRSDEGRLFVTLPARAGKAGRYVDYLRPVVDGTRTTKAFKEEILRHWEASQGEGESDR
jgi:DNA-binding cell septation regulator SpoVG